MKRVGLLLVLINLLLPTIKAQSSLNISGGAAMPMGNFASTTLDGGGFAKTGYVYGLEFSYYTPIRLGFGVQLNYSKSPLDIDALEHGVMSQYGYKSTLLSSVGSYSSFSLLAIGGYKIIDGDNFSLTGNVGAGGAKNEMSNPLRFGVSSTGYYNNYISYDCDTKYTFAYTIGTRFVYYVSQSLGLSAGVWFYSSSVGYKMDNQDIKTAKVTTISDYPVANNVLDFRLGIVFGN